MSYWTRVVCGGCGFVLMHCVCKDKEAAVESVARAIYGAFPQQYVGVVRTDGIGFSEPDIRPATWDDEPDVRKEYVRKLARAAIGAMGET